MGTENKYGQETKWWEGSTEQGREKGQKIRAT